MTASVCYEYLDSSHQNSLDGHITDKMEDIFDFRLSRVFKSRQYFNMLRLIEAFGLFKVVNVWIFAKAQPKPSHQNVPKEMLH